MLRASSTQELEARLVSAPVATRYLGGERPERFGVEPIKGRRQRLYDRRAIDAALDRLAGFNPDPDVANGELDALSQEWR
jgi:hypothetical protein